MDILEVLHQEESKLQQQLTAIQGAIKALNGHFADAKPMTKVAARKRRVISAAGRARISKAAKERWVQFRAQKAKGRKAK